MIVGFKVNGAEGDTAEANTLTVGVVQDFDGVPVEGRRLGRRSRRRELGPPIIIQRPRPTGVRGPYSPSSGRSCERLAYFIFLGS
jgi:hypothetical protein